MTESRPTGDSIVFLGSGGARIVVARQLRASGGIWFELGGTKLLVDPGPGSLVRMTASRHRLDASELSGILLSHRHLDHSGDINNVIEAMTMGGTEPRGILLAPEDALEGEDPVVLRYPREFLSGIERLREGGFHRIGVVDIETPVRHRHRGEVYGFRLIVPGLRVSYVADTAYFPELAEHYQAEVVILNVVRAKASDLDHLHLPDAEALISQLRPRLAILSHFGLTMLRARPWKVARELTDRTGVQVVAATDGKKIGLDRYRHTPSGEA